MSSNLRRTRISDILKCEEKLRLRIEEIWQINQTATRIFMAMKTSHFIYGALIHRSPKHRHTQFFIGTAAITGPRNAMKSRVRYTLRRQPYGIKVPRKYLNFPSAYEYQTHAENRISYLRTLSIPKIT
jgi:hypothetical protein